MSTSVQLEWTASTGTIREPLGLRSGSACKCCQREKNWLPAAKTQGGIKGCS